MHCAGIHKRAGSGSATVGGLEGSRPLLPHLRCLHLRWQGMKIRAGLFPILLVRCVFLANYRLDLVGCAVFWDEAMCKSESRRNQRRQHLDFYLPYGSQHFEEVAHTARPAGKIQLLLRVIRRFTQLTQATCLLFIRSRLCKQVLSKNPTSVQLFAVYAVCCLLFMQ